MTSAQKVIKYFAIALAVFLIVNIFSGIYFAVYHLGSIFFGDNREVGELEEHLLEKENTSILDIDIASSNLTIKLGDTLKVETNNKYIKSKEDENRISIKEKKHNVFSKNIVTDVILYLPQDKNFDKIIINTGAGTIDIDSLITKDIDIDLGAGKVNINNLVASSSASIDGGAGEVTISNGNIHNLDLDIGVGEFNLTTILTGANEIDAGVGELNISLLDSKDNYSVKASKGLGDIVIDGDKVKSDTSYGDGVNNINISGGIGSIKVKFNNSSNNK